MFGGCEMLSPQHGRACGVRQCVTQRKSVIGFASLLDGAYCGAHRLIRKPLKPKNPRKYRARRHALIVLKANEIMGSFLGRDEISQHVLGVSARAGLITQ